ncbi:unnamed protein product [Phytophthora lilii]|uniref:Unnamed protein product n=1 Tax=Phytophthora lilii TaxID=2077276 RepID=A0A9W7D9G8_9STRA|nr:unnamed protein product [Phytophthora lilii]
MSEPAPELALSPPLRFGREKRRASSLWRLAIAATLKLLVAVCFVLFIGGQAAYMTPLYRNYVQPMIATWWGSHDEMVDPAYLLIVGIAPTLICVAAVQWLRRLRCQRGVWSVAKLLRRRPSAGGLSYGELLFLVILVGGNVLVFWYGFIRKHGHRPRFTGDPPHPSPPSPPSGPPYVRMIGNVLGFNCVFNMTMLFLPATRNSAWMEFINLSYANGIKYHRWLGVAAVLTGIVHCGCYYWSWLQDGRWKQMALPCWECSLWDHSGRKIWINVFGEAALLCFLLIGVTSIPWVRRRMYNLFYNVHQLLFVAVVFTVLHWARALWFLFPTFIAYLISRVISHCNGSSAAKVIEFSALSPTLCKIVVACTPSDRGHYQVGQFVYVNVPAISRLEWHPFTIASSPRTSPFYQPSVNTMTLLVKALGDWTNKLMIYQQTCERHSINPEVYVDGYYGASLVEVYSAYATVVLVGGGVGITPLLGLLEDACAAAEVRQTKSQSPIPRRVLVVFVMRELELLKDIYPLLLRIRDMDPQERYISVNLTLTIIPRPQDLDASLFASTSKPEKYSPVFTSAESEEFKVLTTGGKPFGTSLGPTNSLMVQFIAFGCAVGLVVTFQFGNGVLVAGLQDSVWVIQLVVKTSALFVAGLCVFVWVELMKWARSTRATLAPPYFTDNLGLKESLLPQAPVQTLLSGVSTFRDLVSEFQVSIGRRPNLATQMRDLHAGHRQRCSNGSPIGVFVSGPGSLKTAATRAAAAIDAADFDIHGEESEL